MRLLPDTVAGRTILVLLVGLTFSHVVSMSIYQQDLTTELGARHERQVAQRLETLMRAVSAVPPTDRDRTAHTLSGHGFEAHWGAEPAVREDSPARSAEIEARIRDYDPELGQFELRMAQIGASGGHQGNAGWLVSARLEDGTWANLTLLRQSNSHGGSLHLILSTMFMGITVVGFSIVAVRALTAPLRELAQAAERLGRQVSETSLPETGPREVRQVLAAYNDMQARIRRMISDRTNMIAAISHDLRTPITRLKLRAELVGDDQEREKMLSDLGEMEAMITSVLAFLREESTTEEVRTVNLSTLLATLCDDAADSGSTAVFHPNEQLALVMARPLGLKRALANLIDNGIKYGGGVSVSIERSGADWRVLIEDGGPGIPSRDHERVFQPFLRLENSRSRQTGGTGLGLTVARSIIRAHGGEIEFINSPPHDRFGVLIRLPALP